MRSSMSEEAVVRVVAAAQYVGSAYHTVDCRVETSIEHLDFQGFMFR